MAKAKTETEQMWDVIDGIVERLARHNSLD